MKKTKFGTVTKPQLLSIIREFCTDCYGGSYKERQDCCSYDCKLWPFRNGDGHPEDRPGT